jgi:hypothetical protein
MQLCCEQHKPSDILGKAVFTCFQSLTGKEKMMKADNSKVAISRK